jgi:hypothetical protein
VYFEMVALCAKISVYLCFSTYLPEVLQFIPFLEYKSINFIDEIEENDALWDAVQANQAYKAQHPDEVLE